VGGVLGAASASGSEPPTRIVPQVSVEPRPVFKAGCEYPALADRATCQRYMDDFEERVRKSAAASTTPTTAKPTTPPPATIEDGQYAVPAEVKPGTYRAPNPDGDCYWARLKGFSGDLDDVLANGNPSGPARVTIAPTDKGFESARCGGWTKVG
jgi:hypothetical protein